MSQTQVKKRIYLFKRDDCVNCPAADMIIEELERELDGLVVTRADADEMDEDLEYELGLNQIFIFSTPSIVIFNEKKKKLETFSMGEVPDINKLKFALGVC